MKKASIQLALKADVSLPMWCGRKDSNLHALAPEPKSGVSANSTTSAQQQGGAHLSKTDGRIPYCPAKSN